MQVVKEPKAWTPVVIEEYGVAKRGLNEETCKLWDYGYGTDGSRRCHVANYRDPQGQLVAQKLRYAGKDFRIQGDWSKAGLWGRHLWRDSGKALIITEGEADAMSVSQVQGHKWPVVSLPGGASSAKKALQRELEWIDRFESVVLMFDMDEVGQKAARECSEVLSPGKCKIAKLPLKDANDLLKAGRGPEIITAFWAARPYRPDGILLGEAVWDVLSKPSVAGDGTFPHAGLDQMTEGMRLGEVVVFTAGTGVGKTTFCREGAFDLATRQDQMVGWIGLEENVKRSALGFAALALNRPLHRRGNEVSPEDLKRAFDQYGEKIAFYDHFGSIASENLIAKIRYMAKGLGCKFIFLDHLTIAVTDATTDDNERSSIDKLMVRLSSIAQEAQVCIIVVSHLRRTEGKPHEEGKAVTLADLRGSHGIVQNARTVIALERDQQAEGEGRDITKVRVLKCTHTGETGPAGYLGYNRKTGRLLEVAGPVEGEEGF